ncbi:MAG: hypothetical protein OXU36_17895 [Candidatus Poribacteria bacterium]|nr:hypothetical protein [Candidatus Poribacteria bacterium]
MANKTVKITLRDALYGEFERSMTNIPEEESELVSDLQKLGGRLEGREYVQAFIARVQRYAAEGVNLSIDDDFANIHGRSLLQIRATIREVLWGNLSLFITDEHRKFVVRCHARGISTADAVSGLIKEDAAMGRLAEDDALDVKSLRKELVHRMAYLKPGTARWPERKYGVVWREARDSYKQMMRDIPLTSPGEQVAVLAKHVDLINSKLENDDYDVKDFQMLTDSLMKTIERLQKVSAVETQASANLSAPQLVAVLERLTLALDAPEQLAISGDTGALISVLEQLAGALKASGKPKALGEGTEELMEDAEVVSVEGGGDSSEPA